MAVTRDRFEARLAELKQALEQLKQQFAATTGAIADIDYWLTELDKDNQEIKE